MSNSPVSLITGAIGLAGRALSKRLLDEGHSLRVLVLKGDPLLDDYLSLFECSQSIEVCLGDITDYNAIRPYFDGVDCIYHVAAFVKGGCPGKSISELMFWVLRTYWRQL